MAFDKRKALQNALAYTQQGKWDRAIAEYQSILRADPRDVTVCNNLGDLYARAGKTAEAIEQYMKLGELYRADGLSVKAIAVYKKIVKLDPMRTEAYVACADLYWEQGLVGEAKIQMATVVEHYSKAGERSKLIDTYKRLTQFDPTNSAVIARLADLMLREGMRDAAAAEYERAAQAAQAAGQTADAKRLLQKARDLSPGAPQATLALAEELIGAGKLPDAVEVLNSVTSAEPENGQAWRVLGEALASQQRVEEGISALQRALALGVPEAEVARPLGLALLRAGRPDDAVGLCQRVIDARLATGAPDAAIACCRDLIEAAPQLSALHACLAATLQRLGRTEEAALALRDVAAAQESAGQTEAAIATYHRLLEIVPSDAGARARLEALEPPPPAPALEEPPMPEVAGKIAMPHVEAAGVPQAEVPDASLSSLEDLGLSLGAEDAALLLEETDSGAAASVTEPASPALETEAVRGEKPQDEPLESTDWLTQELQALDLAQTTSETQAPQAEWGSGGPSIELEDLAADLDGADLSGLADDATLGLNAPAGPVDVGAVLDAPVVEVPSGPADSDAGLLDLPLASPEAAGLDRLDDDARSGHVAEQLAEADVYQKYGLEEKARERLLEVIRLAPDHVTARRRLKAIYLDRRQTEEVCAESLAIARILRERSQEDAAVAEIREGLSLAPDHPALLEFLVGSPLTAGREGAAHPTAPAPGLPPGLEVVPPSVHRSEPPVVVPAVEDAVVDEPPPPDVPLLLDLEGAAEGTGSEASADRLAMPIGEESLPTELQALLNGSETEPEVVLTETGNEPDQATADDVAEAEFYLSQGMTEEARAVHRRMQVRDPQHPAVGALAEQINRAVAARTGEVSEPAVTMEPPSLAEPSDTPSTAPVASEAPPEKTAPQFAVTSELPAETQAGFVNLGAELDQELSGGEPTTTEPVTGPLVDGLVKELQKGVREQLDEKDYETHYNLGIAYKEMELYDEAIQEFRLTAREPKRALECADLVGLCYLAKGQPEQAIQDLQAGLAIEGYPPEAYHHLRYDLGTALEAVGDLPRALGQFEILQSEGARFLDLQARLEALRARIPRTPVPTATDGTPRRKKKISFI